MGMQDISKIASKIQDEADPDANIIFGATVNENMNDKVSITLIATDFTKRWAFPLQLMRLLKLHHLVFVEHVLMSMDLKVRLLT